MVNTTGSATWAGEVLSLSQMTPAASGRDCLHGVVVAPAVITALPASGYATALSYTIALYQFFGNPWEFGAGATQLNPSNLSPVVTSIQLERREICTFVL